MTCGKQQTSLSRHGWCGPAAPPGSHPLLRPRFPQPHQVQDRRGWSAWHRPLGNPQGDPANFPPRPLPSRPVAEGAGPPQGPGTHSGQHRKEGAYHGPGGLRRHPLPDDRRQRRGQDRLLPLSQPGVRLRLRHEFPGPGYQRGCDTLRYKECPANTLKIAAHHVQNCSIEFGGVIPPLYKTTSFPLTKKSEPYQQRRSGSITDSFIPCLTRP